MNHCGTAADMAAIQHVLGSSEAGDRFSRFGFGSGLLLLPAET